MAIDHWNEQQASDALPGSPAADKRPYAKPELKPMGELRSLTQFSF